MKTIADKLKIIGNTTSTTAVKINVQETDGTVNTIAKADLVETPTTIKTKLGITTLSGSNTGDQDLSSYVPKASPTFTGTVSGITKTMVGLGNVDNTTDLLKPISTATQTALNLKEDKTNKNTANGYAGLGSDGKLISSQLPSITISDTFVTASQAAMLALIAETGDVAVRTDLNKSFILKGTNPAVLADWQELLTPTSAVTTVFGRNGGITAQTGDYTTDQITETANRKFQTANQNTFNDATSSIQNQLNNKENSFSKNSSFNKNFGTTSGTVAQGDDARINNGQTAFGWGNHSGLYPTYSGAGATGTWGISISGNSATSSNSTLWRGLSYNNSTPTDSPLYFMCSADGVTYGYTPLTSLKTVLGLGSNAYTSTAYLPLTGGTLSGAITGTSATFSSTVTATGLQITNSLPLVIVTATSAGGVGVFGHKIKDNGTEVADFTYNSGTGENRIGGLQSYVFPTFYSGGVERMRIATTGAATFSSSVTATGGVVIPDNLKIVLGSSGGESSLSRNTPGIPNVTLKVAGTNALVFADSGAATFSSSVTATGFFNSSDRRLKDIISRDGDVAYFKWKDGRDEKLHIGYIAQEVKKEFPDQVQEDDKGMLSVNYIEILVAKIQALENRIKTLENGI